MKTILIIVLIFVGLGIAIFLFGLLFFFWNSSPLFSEGAKVIDKNISNQYYFKEDGIVYVNGANFFSFGAIKIEQADVASFTVLAYNLAKDKNNVYHEEMIIEGANPDTFHLVSGIKHDKKYISYAYTKDDKNVFYFHESIKGADATTYKHLWGDFSKDAKSLFYNKNKILSISENPLPVKNDNSGNYLITGDTVYFEDKQIVGAKADDFEAIKENFSKDSRAVYFTNKTLTNADSGSFELLNESYQRDKNHLYYKTKPLKNSDPKSYKFISTLFSKDKNQLYYIGRIVINSNMKDYSISKLKKTENDINLICLYYDDNHVLFVKKKELVKLSESHNLYNNEVYYFNIRIVEADHKSFKALQGGEASYALDKNNVFHRSNIIKHADAASFQVINSQFSKDKNHVYYFGKKLLNVAPVPFMYKEGMYGETIDKEYYRLVYP